MPAAQVNAAPPLLRSGFINQLCLEFVAIVVRTGKVMFHKISEHRWNSCASVSVLLDEDLATQVQGVLRMLGGSWERFAQVLEGSAIEPRASDSAPTF